MILMGPVRYYDSRPIPQMILGDSGYPNLSKLITPYKKSSRISAFERRRRHNYNKRVSKGRIIVENTIGALKMRFPILKNQIRLHKKKFSPLIMGCIILHNPMNSMGVPLPNDEEIAAEYPNSKILDDPVAGTADWDGVTEFFETRTLITDFV